MTAVAAGRIERSTMPLQTGTGHASVRKATDENWSILFIVVLIILVISGRNVVRPKSDCHAHSSNTIATSSTSDLYDDAPISYEIFCNVIVEYMSHIWGKNWLFDVVTCNVAFLDVHYENSGVIVILAHLLICGALIVYSFSSMPTDDLYCRQMQIFAFFFLICTFIACVLFGSSERNVLTDLFIRFHSLSGVILFIVVCSKSSVLKRFDTRLTSLDFEPHISITIFLMSSLWWIKMIVAVILLLFLLFGEAMKNCEWSFNNGLSSYIFVGAILYMCLTYYYFLLMILSCATSMSFGSEFPKFKNFFRALYVVTWYHFGTACYHATLIFPAIHATLVMNEKEFKEIANFSTAHRFYLTHWKVDDLSMMVTATRGYDHAASTREMMRLFTRDSPKLKNFQSYKKMLRSLSALLMSINSLMLMSFWVHGVPLATRSVMGVWVASLIGMSVANLIAESFDAVADVLWFHDDGTIAIRA